MDDLIKQMMATIHLAQRLKMELRHSWLTNSRQESVAEHTWRLSFMAVLVKPYLDQEVDMAKLLQMIIIHDIVEAEAGDVPAFDTMADDAVKRAKHEREIAAIERLKASLPIELGQHIYELWFEFEAKDTYEAKVANALDKLEAQIQHNEADLSTWIEVEYGMTYQLGKHVQFDSFLTAFQQEIEREGHEKLVQAGIIVQ